MYRLSIYTTYSEALPDSLVSNPCTLQVIQAYPITEVWVRCPSVDRYIGTVEAILEASSIMGFGTLRGRVVLPSLHTDILEIALEDTMLSGVVNAEASNTAQIARVMELPITSASVITRKKKLVKIRVKSINASQLFDLGLRIIKPIEAPPKPQQLLRILELRRHREPAKP